MRLSEALDQAYRLDPSSAEFALGVRSALDGLSREAGLLSDAQREGGPDCYRRHLLAADPLGRYAVAALVWRRSGKPGAWSSHVVRLYQ